MSRHVIYLDFSLIFLRLQIFLKDKIITITEMKDSVLAVTQPDI